MRRPPRSAAFARESSSMQTPAGLSPRRRGTRGDHAGARISTTDRRPLRCLPRGDDGLAVIARLFAVAVTIFARLVTGVHSEWRGCLPEARQRIYFANHSSHGDFVLIWTVLPAALRRRTRPVAAADYWRKGRLRRFIGQEVFDAVLIDRDPASRQADPVELLLAALHRGASLIFFPEGTRNTTGQRLLPFRGGLYRLASARP